MLTVDRIAALLSPYVTPTEGLTAQKPGISVDWSTIYDQLAVYLELILRWNARTNLTAIREPEDIVRRHFGESLFAGRYLGECKTLLDFGSGAGFPGVPIQLMRQDIHVTLAESQGKKASFLREVVRELGLQTEVWAGRVETMPAGQSFEAVAMRAVDKMEVAAQEAKKRVNARWMVLGTGQLMADLNLGADFRRIERVPIPNSTDGILLIASR